MATGNTNSLHLLLEQEVIANPTLDGTEDDLTGLQVDGTKYKVPSGGGEKKYLHNIIIPFRLTNLSINVTFLCTFNIINNSNTALTLANIVTTLNTIKPAVEISAQGKPFSDGHFLYIESNRNSIKSASYSDTNLYATLNSNVIFWTATPSIANDVISYTIVNAGSKDEFNCPYSNISDIINEI